MARAMLEERIDQLSQELGRLLALAAGWPDGGARADLERLRVSVEALSVEVNSSRARFAHEEAQVREVLDVLSGMADLDFSRRAPLHGDGPLDALARSANLLSEEMAAARSEMAAARTTAEAATLAKSRFLAHMSHEIRTPLTALIGFADLLASPALSESDRLNYATIIRRNGEHLLAVINDVLDLSRIEAGGLQLELVECAPARILGEVASLMRLRAHQSGLEFEARLDGPIPATLRSDPTRLRQVLLNLVGNAVKFTLQGSVRLVARLDERRAEAPRLVVEVADTGIGIAPHQMERLFLPFQQADQSMSRRFGGSGLGLTISAALASALGGAISVESTVGRGSTFRLELPCPPGGERVTALDEIRADAGAGLAAPRFAGSVLVAEDGVDNQVLVMTLLRHYGLSVGVAPDGRLAMVRALEASERGSPYDLILMDMQMPVMDGYQATAALRRAGYPGPIVALTAHAMADERDRCLAAGCDDYVRKPIDRTALVAVLARYLRPQAADDEPAAEALLHSTYAHDPEMEEVVGRFVASLPERIAGLRAEARTPGSAHLLRLCHHLKGAAGGYGFQPITVTAASLEDLLRAGAEQAAVLRAIDDLEAVCARARAGRPGA